MPAKAGWYRQFAIMGEVSSGELNTRRLWLYPMVILGVVALTVWVGFYVLDYFVTASGGDESPYTNFDPDSIGDAVPSLAGMIAAVLGIVITVVSIIVQLSADRYTGVAQMFLRDRINVGVMAYFVVACVCGVWLSMSLKSTFVPRAGIIAMMAAVTFGLVLMLPYFAYVFWFLEPGNIIARIRRDAVETVFEGALHETPSGAASLQVPTVTAMEELTDITSNSISGKDKIIASRAVDALKDFTIAYLDAKEKADEHWFSISEALRENPDFVAMDPESLTDLETRRTWVEWKVLRQYLGIYREAMASMPDINYLIAIDTRYIGEAAGKLDDRELMTLVFRFMNSYMRATLNARDVRTAYNVLNQYRKLVEAMLKCGHGKMAVEGVKHMNYYGHVSYDMKVTFVTETVAYDVSSLCQHAHELGVAEQDEMLTLFLELDQPLRVKKQESGLLGVRKAQVKLAAYYLSAGEEAKARLIADDMKDEPRERLETIRGQLESVTSKDFWEIIDRGRNFEYMPPAQREQMGVFFSWMGLE
jgi:hypothetical protein